MSDALYVAMTGAQQSMLAQAVSSNNLANVNTTGFRADLYNAMSVSLFGEAYPSQAYVVSEEPAADLTPGAIITTGRELDIAVQGEGWIAVQAPDGSEAYTRTGNLTISASGQLLTGAGYPVLGNGGPVAIPAAEKIEIAGDGTISIRPVGQEATALAVLDRIKLVKPANDELAKGEDGLFRVTGGGTANADASVTIVSGALESSNVNAVGEMINIIALARQFEMQIKLMQEADQNGEVTAGLLTQ